MAWVTCPQCGFTQIASAICQKCRHRLDRPGGGAAASIGPAAHPGTSATSAASPAAPPARTTPVPPSSAAPARPRPTSHAGPPSASAPANPSPLLPRNTVIGLAAAALALVVLAIVWSSRDAAPVPVAAVEAPPTPEPWTLDLTGRWQGKVATTLPGPPARPALREVFVETDRSGNIVAAGVTLTDPSHGGAGAGYLTVPNGRERLNTIASATLASPKGASLALDFIPLPPWAPQRERQWRAVEGQRRTVEDTSYLLLESLETDYLIQAGVNASGFLSYLYLSPDYVPAVAGGKNSGRGTDVLSRVIHPTSENSLRGFRNLVWDLSGAADFVSLQIGANLSGPAGTSDRVVLRRK